MLSRLLQYFNDNNNNNIYLSIIRELTIILYLNWTVKRKTSNVDNEQYFSSGDFLTDSETGRHLKFQVSRSLLITLRQFLSIKGFSVFLQYC